MATMFESLTLKGKEVKNRVVFPPCVCFDPGVANGSINNTTIEHYKQVAKAGFGLIIVEATCVVKDALITPTQLGIWDDSFIDGLSNLPPIAHNEGAVTLIQIQHSGVRTHPTVTNDMVAPSDYTQGNSTAHALSLEEIETITQQFVDAGIRAKKAGFDGVELHGAHGYLISQFLSPNINKRDDAYGKDPTKFGVDIIHRLRKEVGDDFIIAVRMPGNDPDLTTCVSYAKSFEAAGADLLHISTGFVAQQPADLAYENNDDFNWIVATGIEIKKHVNIPIIVVNGIRTPQQANAILEHGNVDFVALLKAYLCDNDWLQKARTGQDINKCVSCSKCIRFTGLQNCVLNK